MIVLSIAMLGEFLSANVSTPFLLFMVEGFGVPADQVGAKTGLLVSMFFITQFFTSIFWATIADKHGRRAVLGISLLGNALTCFAFGTARSYPEAVVIRLLQGVFNGSLGVARGAVTNITDSTNEARAYAIIGFCWGFGGVAGAVIGGALESPAKKWPNGIGTIPLLVNYPYLLPCAVASSFTFAGAILSLFLGWDGGPREGLIRLPIEKDEPVTLPTVAEVPEPQTNGGQVNLITPPVDNIIERVAEQTKHVQRKISGYFARRVREAHQSPMTPSPLATPIGGTGARAVSMPNTTVMKERTLSRTSHRTELGSAYGYGRSMRSRLASTVAGRSPASVFQRRRMTGQSTAGVGEDEGTGMEDLNFAQRLLLANEGNVTSMANLWVAAAINAENEDPFFDDTPDPTPGEDELPDNETTVEEPEDMGSVFALDDEESMPVTPAMGGNRSLDASRRASSSGASIRPARNLFGAFGGGFSRINTVSPRQPTREFSSPRKQQKTIGSGGGGVGSGSGDYLIAGSRAATRRGSMGSNVASLPTIFNNTGLATPPALAQQIPYSPAMVAAETDEDVERMMRHDLLGRPSHHQSLSAISEGSSSMTDVPSAAAAYSTPASTSAPTVLVTAPKEPSLWKQLPLIIIFQYGILAFHNTVHDQYFLTYLVSPYTMGGLGLNAAHFAQLIALMCLAQIFYQFYLYPNVGPPRGPWSHLAMFRIGSALFIPSYLSVCLYRIFASENEDGNLLVMTLLAVSTALRYCGTTFTYTAITILLNYMSPPHLVSLSNSIGQSTVAFMRFIGPIVGGNLWSYSIKDGASGYPFGFYVVSAICLVAILQSFTIR
ncbi:hypothetical protein FRB98_009283 [Tulasnella sp. 332]|nr:hypothetical protein FRB98_009283 [Tulasnella sp. 332]